MKYGFENKDRAPGVYDRVHEDARVRNLRKTDFQRRRARMRILFCGDVMGRSGRDVIQHHIPKLRQRFQLDCVIVNGENAANGFGITQTICRDFYKWGVDVITTGNHVWDQREIIGTINNDKRLLRPVNYPDSTPGQGYVVHTRPKGQSVLVINAMARLFMEALDDPFRSVEEVLKKYSIPNSVQAIVLDFHGEATSEKMAMGHYCDGRVSLVVGTHTHVPTTDQRILTGGTAYQSDAGMCGDYDSIIGMAKEMPLYKFTRRLPSPERPMPAKGEATLCGLLLVTNDATGLAEKVFPLRLGGCLSQTPLEDIDNYLGLNV